MALLGSCLRDMQNVQFSSVHSLSHVRLCVTPWSAARQASLSITNSRSPPKPMSIELMMPSNHLILCHPLLLLPSIFPIIRVFSNESALHIKWPKYWSLEKCKSKTTMRYHLMPVRMAINKKSTNNKCWRGCGEKGLLLNCWWECKLIQPIWKTVWRFL